MSRARYARVGHPFPDAALPDPDGIPVPVSSLVGGRAAVFVFYRGVWSPSCNAALRRYERDLLPGLVTLGVTLVALSPQLPEGSMLTMDRNDLTFPVLTDPGNYLAHQLGIVVAVPERDRGDWPRGNGDESGELPLPTVVVVDHTRTIRFLDVRPERTEPGLILDAVRACLGPVVHHQRRPSAVENPGDRLPA